MSTFEDFAVDEIVKYRERIEKLCQQRATLRSALLMMKHAYETDNRPNMFIVNEALGEDNGDAGT